MVVAGSENAEVAKTVDNVSIFRCVVADCNSVASNFAIDDVVRSLITKEEDIAARYGDCGDGGSLNESRSASRIAEWEE